MRERQISDLRLRCHYGVIDCIAIEPHNQLLADHERRGRLNSEPLQLLNSARRLPDIDLLEWPSLFRQILCRLMAGRSAGLGINLDHYGFFLN